MVKNPNVSLLVGERKRKTHCFGACLFLRHTDGEIKRRRFGSILLLILKRNPYIYDEIRSIVRAWKIPIVTTRRLLSPG